MWEQQNERTWEVPIQWFAGKSEMGIEKEKTDVKKEETSKVSKGTTQRKTEREERR